MQMELISVVVPIYNVENYIEKCLDSIINQSYRNLEIILIDDGSTDKSSEICDRYKQDDERIMVIHKQNGGLSSARNAGLNIASGEYIGFVDSDDYIEYDMFELLLQKSINMQVDIVGCGVNFINNNSVIKRYCENEEKIINSFEAVIQILENKNCNAVWNKLYKRDIFNDINFEEGKLYEDTFLLPKVFSKKLKVMFINQCKYNYFIRSNSIMGKSTIRPNVDLIEAYNNLLNFLNSIEEYNIESNLSLCIQKPWFYTNSIYINKACKDNKLYLQAMHKFIRNNLKLIISNKYISWDFKYEIILFYMLYKIPFIYLFFLKFKNKCISFIN